MNGPLIVSIAMLTAVVWGIALAIVAIRRRRRPLATVGAILCLPVTTFCLYGLCASFEPGVGVGWRIGYASIASLFLVAAAALSARVLGGRR